MHIMLSSNFSTMKESEPYQELLKEGKKILPVLAKQLDGQSWLPILLIFDIVGHDKIEIPEEHKGNLKNLNTDCRQYMATIGLIHE